MAHLIQVQITGSKQGKFHSDDPAGKAGPIRCVKMDLSAKKKNDAGRQGAVHSSATASLNKPVILVLPWGPSSPQCWQAYWSNEVLSTVTIVGYHGDGSGATNKVLHQVTLTNATIVGIQHTLESPVDGTTPSATQIPGSPLLGALHVRMRYEQIQVEHPPSQTQAQHGTAQPLVPSIMGK